MKKRIGSTGVEKRVFPLLSRFLEPGLLGNYEWFEVIEIGYSIDSKVYYNVLSIYVPLEVIPSDIKEGHDFINKQKRQVEGVVGYSFSVVRKFIKLESLLQAAENFDKSGSWQSIPPSLIHNKLQLDSPIFCPPDGTVSVPMNCVLKNNFWNGSYVIELAAADKEGLYFLIKNRKALNSFSEWVKKIVYMDIASLPDRLGNIIIQLPVNSLDVRFSGFDDDGISVKLEWHPDVKPRQTSGIVSLEYDQTIIAYGQKVLNQGYNSIVYDTTRNRYEGFVWDVEKNVLLAANPTTYYFGKNVSIDSYVTTGSSKSRVFYEADSHGSLIRKEIYLKGNRDSVHRKSIYPNGDWTERRISDNEIQKLVKSKYFMQYGSVSRDEKEHERAIEDIRGLLNTHGKKAAYLWDPYLSCEDILATMFHCAHIGSELRALTSWNAVDLEKGKADKDGLIGRIIKLLNSLSGRNGKFKKNKREVWINGQQKKILDSVEGDQLINLEFRMSFGPKGWPFHDRFLIFPDKENESGAPKVWSLGSSVNHLGRSHAIVQQVAHSQPVLDAFEDLWNRIDSNEHLIWKSA